MLFPKTFRSRPISGTPSSSKTRFTRRCVSKKPTPTGSVRINRGYRALARCRGNTLFWFWIGPHDEYERILKG